MNRTDPYSQSYSPGLERLILLGKKPIEPVKLMVPNKLKLNPGDAEIIKERQNVFSKFGFKFSFDSNNAEVYLVESGKIGKHIMDESDIYE